MAGVKKESGPSSVRVARNLRRIRQSRGISYAELSRILERLGHPISDTGLMKIEKESRRVDVDDLVALSAALGCTPNTLLLPVADVGNVTYLLTPGRGGFTPGDLWSWAAGNTQLPGISPTRPDISDLKDVG